MDKELTLSEKQQKNLSLLLEFASICERNNLKYYLAYGTLLGSVRHEGFIPWDDDVDVWMPRQDYEQLKTVDLPEGLWLCTPDNENSVWSFAKLMDTETYFVEKGVKPNAAYGLFIDIFPLDTLSGYERGRFGRIHRICQAHKFSYALMFDGGDGLLKLKKGIGKILGCLGRIFPRSWYVEKMEEMIPPANCAGELYGCLYGGGSFEKSIYRRNDFGEGVNGLFEGHELRIPDNFEGVLEVAYGKDWRIPVKTDRSDHGRAFWRSNGGDGLTHSIETLE